MAELYSIPWSSPFKFSREKRIPNIYEDGRLPPMPRVGNVRVVLDVPRERAGVQRVLSTAPRPQEMFHPVYEQPGWGYSHPSNSQRCNISSYAQRQRDTSCSVRNVMSADADGDFDVGSPPPLISTAELKRKSLASPTSSRPHTSVNPVKRYACPRVGGERRLAGESNPNQNVPDLTQENHPWTHAQVRDLLHDKPYACLWKGCKKTFRFKGNLTQHAFTHSGERRFVCTWDGCNRRFRQKTHLRTHARIHSGEKPYSCAFDGCNRRFSHNNTRIVHERSHSGDKPFACSWEGCSQRFAENSHLKRHVYQVHTHLDENPYACIWEGCSRRFAKNADLKRHVFHLHTHLGEKAYACYL